MPYHLLSITVTVYSVYLWLEFKFHEGSDFCLFCLLLYPQEPRILPGVEWHVTRHSCWLSLWSLRARVWCSQWDSEPASGLECWWLVREVPLKYAAILKCSKALTKCSVLLKAAHKNPFQWNATFIEVLFTPEIYPRGLNSGCAGKCWSSCQVILETEAAKQLFWE